MAKIVKTTVRTKFNFYKNVKTFFYNEAALTKCADVLVKESKILISTGQSPVKDYGRFPGYAIDRLREPWRYPNDRKTKKNYPSKTKRPVNLWLSGEMLAALSAWVIGKRTIVFGIPTSASLDVKKRALTNNEGTDFVPQRRFIPMGDETFKPGIVRSFKNKLSELLDSIVRKTNK